MHVSVMSSEGRVRDGPAFFVDINISDGSLPPEQAAIPFQEVLIEAFSALKRAV